MDLLNNPVNDFILNLIFYASSSAPLTPLSWLQLPVSSISKS